MVDTRPVIDWLIAQALAALPIDRLLTGLSAQLEAAGVPVSRIHLSGTVLDPQTESVGFTWKDETGRAEGTEHRHGSMFEPDFQSSPFMTLMEHFRPIAEQARRGPCVSTWPPAKASTDTPWQRNFCRRAPPTTSPLPSVSVSMAATSKARTSPVS